MLSIDGLVTGIDTTSIIEGLTNIQQRQIGLLESRRSAEVQRQTAFKGIEAGILTLRSVAGRLGRTRGNVFSARTVTSSREDLVTASASNDAATGVYSIKVNQLAQAHQIGSQGYASESAEITQGTISFRIGSEADTQITIDSTNNTLRGLADAVNNADAGVRATIINDGSNGGTPYRLLLTSEKTGTANGITVTNNLGASASGAIKPDFTGAAIQDATNAQISLGSGAGAITVESATNTVENAISGVTLQLTAADATQTLSLTVGRDTESAEDAVDDFIESFNDVMEYIDEQSAFNAETSAAGALLGDRPTIEIQNELRRAVTDSVSGVSTAANRLSSIGVSLNDQGRLVLNRSRLQDVLQGQVQDITDTDLARLFSFSGDSTNANVKFLGGSTRTVDGVAIDVDLSQAATQGVIVGTNTLSASTVIDGTNNSLTIEVDAASATITLGQGTYTETELASLIQDALNNSSDLIGRSVAVGVTGNKLRIISESYGRSSELKGLSGTALTPLGLSGSETGQGQDVVGKFVVDGKDETAVGRGRLLTGDPDNANTGDLQISVTLTAAQVQVGTDATLTLTRGIGSRLDTIIGKLLDPVTGRVKTTNDAFDQRIEDLDESIEKQNELFELRKEALISEFIAMESAISDLQSTSSFLASQLGAVAQSATPNL